MDKDDGALSQRDGIEKPGMTADAGTPGWGPVLRVGGFQLAGMWAPTTQWGSALHLGYGRRSKTRKIMQEGCGKPPSATPMPWSLLVIILTQRTY